MSDSLVASGKAWAKTLIELYTAGASDAEVAAELKIPLKKYYDQINDNTALATLVEFGRTLSQAFWEREARLNIRNKGFNTPLWAFYMKNKFGWADKTEAINVNESMGDLDTVRKEINREVAKYIKQYTPELTDAQRVLQGIAINE